MQIDTRRVPGRTRARAASARGSGTVADAAVTAYGGTITVSAPASTSGPCAGVTVRSESVRTGRPSTLADSTS